MDATPHVQESLEIDAPVEVLYAIVADYQVGHPAILPPSAFGPLIVEQGGVGAGTVTRGSIKVWGREYPFCHEISEPKPGRVLMETDRDTGQVTTFTFEPLEDNARTHVTIATWFPRMPGPSGRLDTWIKVMIARPLYRKELRRLAEYATKQRRPQP